MQGEVGEPPPECRDAVFVERAQAAKGARGGGESALFRRLEPGEAREVPLAPGGELQGGPGEIGAPDLGAAALLETAVLMLAPQAQAPAGGLASGAAGALLGRSPRDPGEGQTFEAGRWIRAALFHPSGVDDAGDAVDGDRGLGDIGGEHDLAPRSGPEDAILLARREIAVEVDDGDVALPGERRERLVGTPDLRHTRKEDEQVAGGRLETPANAARDEGRERHLDRRRIQILERDREEAPSAGDDRRVQVGREALAVERCRHRQELELGARFALHPADQGERQVGEQAALVKLVEENGADAVEERIALQALDEDPFGHEEDAGVAGEVALEADLPADLAPERPALFVGDPPGSGAGGDPPRLEDEDLLRPGDPGRRQRWRHAGRFSGPRRRLQHGICVRAERSEKIAQNLIDRQSRHPPMLPVRPVTITGTHKQDTQTGHTNRTHKQDTQTGHTNRTRLRDSEYGTHKRDTLSWGTWHLSARLETRTPSLPWR